MERDEFVICNGAGCCCCAALKGNMCNALSNHKTHNEEKIQIGVQKSQKKIGKKYREREQTKEWLDYCATLGGRSIEDEQ